MARGEHDSLELSTPEMVAFELKLSLLEDTTSSKRHQGDMRTTKHIGVTFNQFHYPSIFLFIPFCYILNRLYLKNTSVLAHNTATVQLVFLSLVCFSQTHSPYFPEVVYLKYKSHYTTLLLKIMSRVNSKLGYVSSNKRLAYMRGTQTYVEFIY